MIKLRNHNGFTLVELSIVLILVGLLIGIGATMIKPLTIFAKSRETRTIADANLLAIMSAAASSNTIPNSAGLTTVVTSPNDAWNQPFVYLYDTNLYSATPSKDTLCGRNSTGLKLTTADATITNVAFAFFSRADNSTFSSTLNGTLAGVPINNLPLSTSGAATGTITATAINGDLLRWVTLDELRSKIGCQGAPLKIVNNELPFGNYSTDYSATVVADGGSGSSTYQWRIKKGNSGLPTGINSGALPFANISTTDWMPASSLALSGYPKQSGSFHFTIQVRDSFGNNNSRPFVLTINPRSN
jgi:prepilin-type N-terminal cleavage/methylation domain-containing protein